MSTPKPVPKPLPSVESLRCFFAAAQHLNFRRAAGEVGLTATAFSERIRALERELSTTLFTRTTRRVELTTAGRALVPACEQALGSVLACVKAVTAPESFAVRLRIATRCELGLSWLLPALSALERERPNFQVDLYFGSGADILDQLERGADCSFGVVLTGNRRAPHGHHRVTDELLDDAAVTFDGEAGDAEVLVEGVPDCLGVTVLRERREADQVDEHHADETPLRSRRGRGCGCRR